MSPQLWALSADVVAIIHGMVVIFMLSHLVVGPLFKFKTPTWCVVSAVSISLISIVSFFICGCPLVILENHFRDLAGLDVYQTSFIAHYTQSLLNIDLSYGLTEAIRVITGITLGVIFVLLSAKLFPKKEPETRSC